MEKENFEIVKEKRTGTFVGFWVLFPLPKRKKARKYKYKSINKQPKLL
jgi:hypothetical protein